MKKFLAIILCAALVMGMLPAAFATTGEPETLEYVFSYQAIGETKKANISVTDYNKVLPDVSPNSWITVDSYRAAGGYLVDGSFYFASNANRCSEGNNGITFKIKVPEGVDGVYFPEISYFQHASGAKMNVYIVPASAADSLSSTLGSAYTQRILADFVKNPTTTSVEKIVDQENTHGTDAIDTEAYDQTKIKTVSSDQALELKAGEYYLLFALVGYAEGVTGVGTNSAYYIHPSSLKLIPAEPDKTHTFKIDTGAMTDTAEAAAGAAYTSTGDNTTGLAGGVLRPGTGLQFINELSEIDSSDSNRWALRYKAPAADGTASAQDTATLTIQKRGGLSSAVVVAKSRYGTDHYEAKLALLLEISYAGKYKLTVNGGEAPHGTAADVYMIPAADVINNNDTISLSFIKKYTPVGRIDEKGTSTEVSYDVGTVELENKNYYIIFVFNSSNTTTNDAKKNQHYFYLSSIVLTEDESEDTVITPDVMTQNELSFAVDANVEGAEVTADIEGYDQGEVAEVSRGNTIKLEAKPLEGYKFVGWRRGVASDARGIYLAEEASFDYKIMTNTYLTAVYVENKPEETTAVEFWNEYGTFFARNEAENGFISVPSASLTGHIFDAWYADGTEKLEVTDNKISVSALSNALTRAMAKYSGTTAVSGYAVANGKIADYDATRSFGDPVTGTDAKATCWRRDGKIVAYDVDTYTHYVWDATQILSSYETITEKTPIVVLEDTAIDGARMIEYDRGDTTKYEICEVGILFGSQEDMVISSCEYKATSQRNSNHGQFSAAPFDGEHTYARGYMIYKDLEEKTYRVIYAD